MCTMRWPAPILQAMVDWSNRHLDGTISCAEIEAMTGWLN